MIARADQSPFGSHAPGRLDRAVLAVTRSLPVNWLGLRLAILLRRIVTMRHKGAFDIELWGLRLRLHPLGNGCEKNALFTPQMYDVAERGVLAEAIAQRLAAGGDFTFVDVGASVGLYSLFVAARAGKRARICDRAAARHPRPLALNLAANPDVEVECCRLPSPITPARLCAHRRGRRRHPSTGTRRAARRTVSVPCRPLLAILREVGIADRRAEDRRGGAEDLALVPFLATLRPACCPASC